VPLFIVIGGKYQKTRAIEILYLMPDKIWNHSADVRIYLGALLKLKVSRGAPFVLAR
jgi:hypothetical protein